MYTRSQVLSLIESSDKAVETAIITLFQRQTESERKASFTIETNGVGFNSADANYGSYLARWVLAGKSLSGKHLHKARKIAKRYVGQLVSEVNIGVEVRREDNPVTGIPQGRVIGVYSCLDVEEDPPTIRDPECWAKHWE